MRDSEFYDGPEHWPQPEDDGCTLSGTVSTTISFRKKLKASSAKLKKQASESMAGAAAAVVGVAVLAGALPEVMALCPVCQREDALCPYYAVYGPETAYYNVELTAQGNIRYSDESNIYAIPGFTESDRQGIDCKGYVYAESDHRVVMTVDDELYRMVPGVKHAGETYANGAQLPYCGVYLRDDFDKSVSTQFMTAVLVNVKGNGKPDLAMLRELTSHHLDEFDLSAPEVRFHMEQVSGARDVWLVLGTNVSGFDPARMKEHVATHLIDGHEANFALGSTMELREGERLHRDYRDQEQIADGTYNGIVDKQDHFLIFNFDTKVSYIHTTAGNSCEIRFSTDDWNNIFGQWQDLNIKAPRYGHEIPFPLLHLFDITCNDISYSAYAAFYDRTGDGQEYELRHYYVPQQEPTVCFQIQETITAEDVQLLQQTQTTLAISEELDYFLPYIYLK